jgi:hypothetical protein
VSTAQIPHEGLSPCPGIWLCRTEDGIPVLQIRYYADPDKHQDWAATEKKKFTGDAFWEKEMEGHAHALEGQLVYPEFDPSIHIVLDELIPKRGCRYMSIDPHPRTPHAMLWVLIDGWGDWYVYREYWPSVVYGQSRQLKETDREFAHLDGKPPTVKEYAEAIAYMERNTLEWHNRESPNEYAIYRREVGGEHIIDRYMDQAGKAFRASDEAALTETYASRYHDFGIQCCDPKKSLQVGEDAIRDLLRLRQHEIYGDWPKLHIAASCSELRLEFERHRYKATRHWSDEKELKQEGVEARRHMLDNLRYLATAELSFLPSKVS